MFKKCLENRIIRHEGNYKCYLCHYEINRSFDLVEEHLLTDKHKEKLIQVDTNQRKNESDSLAEISESQLRLIVENWITFDRCPALFYCLICKCTIGDLCKTLVHIRELSHRLGLKEFAAKRKIRTNKMLYNNNTASQLSMGKSSNSEASIAKFQSESNSIISDEKTNSYQSNICISKMITIPHITQQDLLHQDLESELMSSTSNLKSDCIVYDEKYNSYHCTICKCKIVGNVSEHIQESLHQTLFGTQKTLEMKKIGVACQEFVNQTIPESQKGLEDKQETPKPKTVLQKNSLESCFSEIRCCNICQAVLENNAEFQFHVMLHLFKEFKLLNNFDILEFKLGTDGKSNLKCLLCDYYYVSSMSDAHKFLQVHFKTETHLKRLKLFKFTKNDPELEDMNEQINSLDLKNFTYNAVDSMYSIFLCKVCDVTIPCTSEHPRQHVSGKSHKKKLNKIRNGTIIKKKDGFDEKDPYYYKCFICNTLFFNPSALFDHYKTAKHKWKLEALKMIKECPYTNFVKSNKTEIINCSLCNIFFYDFKCLIGHILGRRHNDKLELSSIHQESQDNTITAPLVQVTNKLEHLSVSSNEKLSRKQKGNATSVTNQNSSVITNKNLKRIKKPSNFEDSIQGLDTDTVQTLSTLKPDMVANVLDDLVPLDFSNSQIKRLPSLAKAKLLRSPKVEGQTQRNSFAASVLSNGKHYIKFCIDLGLENIYNFDNEKLSLLKLGVSLSMPNHSGRICFPCGQQFPDDVQSLFEHLHKQEHLNNIYKMQVEDKNFEKFPEQFSDLRLAKLYMHVSDQCIQCHACNVSIGDEDEIIKQHAKGLVHQEKSKRLTEQSEQLFNQYLTIYKDIWYYAEHFFCEICKKRFEFEMDFAKHLIHPEHMKKVHQLKFKRTALTFDLCPSCITYWFGKTDSYEAHCQSKFHKRLAKSKDFMVPELTLTASEFLDNINKNVDLIESASDKVNLEKERSNESALLEAILETVKSTYPNAEAYIFGSRLSHLGFCDSDVDVFLDCENVYYTSSTKEQSQQYIKSVRSYFESTPNTWLVDEVLLDSRVPIMKLRHIPTNLKCDISFINGLSVEKSRLVGLYNVAFPVCRKLILFMKKWLKLCRLFGSDYITTFAISWCVIFYLQLQGILPTVHELMKRKEESKIVDGWQCGFVEVFTAKMSNLSFKEHLKGFFTYFAKFDYQKSVICPYLGKPIDKHTFAYEYVDELPTEMDIYKKRLKHNEVEIFRFDSPMCIQDPIDLSQNMTKALKKQQLRCFRQYCFLSANRC